MAEKRGQYVYNDDGTVATLVSIAGSDASGVSVSSNGALPMDLQNVMNETFVQLSAKAIATNAWDVTAPYVKVDDASKISVRTKVDVSSAFQVDLYWSEDQTNVDCVQTIFTGTGQWNGQVVNTLGSYVKVAIKNTDAASRTYDVKLQKKAV